MLKKGFGAVGLEEEVDVVGELKVSGLIEVVKDGVTKKGRKALSCIEEWNTVKEVIKWNLILQNIALCAF